MLEPLFVKRSLTAFEVESDSRVPQFFGEFYSWKRGKQNAQRTINRTKHAIIYFSCMRCEIKIRLISDYEGATTSFSEAVTELRRRMGTSTKEEYDRLTWAANDARVKSEQARLALEQHVADHRC